MMLIAMSVGSAVFWGFCLGVVTGIGGLLYLLLAFAGRVPVPRTTIINDYHEIEHWTQQGWIHSLYNGHPSRFEELRQAKEVLNNDPQYRGNTRGFRIIHVVEEVVFYAGRETGGSEGEEDPDRDDRKQRRPWKDRPKVGQGRTVPKQVV